MTKVAGNGIQEALKAGSSNPLRSYSEVVVGHPGILALVKYEMITGICAGIPGALGLLMRRKLYKFLFNTCGRGMIIGQNVNIRCPNRIRVGDNVVIGNNCTLDAKGTRGTGIEIENGVFIGESSIISTADGSIRIGEQSNISSFCRIATLTSIDIGRKVLIAAYCYICGGGHRHDRIDIPIMDQPNFAKGPQHIGDGCWIGTRTTVLDGVNIGSNTIIGAHSLVTKDIPPETVALGCPAKVVENRKTL